MGLVTDLIRFLSKCDPSPDGKTVIPRSAWGFLTLQSATNSNICQDVLHPDLLAKLVHEGFLVNVGLDPRGIAPFNCRYLVNLHFDDELIKYGSYDYYINGFSSIRNDFQNSVIPLEVVKDDGNLDIGTGFLFKEKYILTARHCIDCVREVRFPNQAGKGGLVTQVILDNVFDVALICFSAPPMPGAKSFVIRHARVLDEVMTMGYPPIPGFATPLVCETAKIAASMKATTGQVVGSEQNYLDGNEYFLISARVKGGNSGGPVVDRKGAVIGMVTQNSENAEKMDWLGYGQALPGVSLLDFVLRINMGDSAIEYLAHTSTPQGFSVP